MDDVVPDASTPGPQGQPGGAEQEQPPPPPNEQIQNEISTGKVWDWLGGLFGSEWDTPAGGGGTGGQFMFASLAELDGVITQWKAERDAIDADGMKIMQAIGFISPPAGDTMSVGQADATRTSLDALYKHNRAMFDYADGYIKKLEASRASIANIEHSNKTRLGNAH